MMRWTTMSHADLEREYNPSSCVPDGDYKPFVAAYRSESDAAWDRVLSNPDADVTLLRYGTDSAHTVDVAMPVQASSAVPLLVFIHGGYWQELSKLDSRFAAASCLERGWGFAAVDYTLAPAASVDEIVAECRQAVQTLMDNATELGFDPTRVFVAGSSAGGHLAAMVALTADIAGTVLLSGVFELEPLIDLSINQAVGLDKSSVERNSPLRLDVSGFPSTVLTYGENETSESKAQTAAFARHLESAGVAVRMFEVADRNHFDVILELAEPNTPLGDAVAQLIDPGASDVAE